MLINLLNPGHYSSNVRNRKACMISRPPHRFSFDLWGHIFWWNFFNSFANIVFLFVSHGPATWVHLLLGNTALI
uniref:Uncharacterized protein n=1 Tax=Anguilla anguilla TaxID=7936 RepID=A0A0E9T2G2_ANGAN